MELYLLESLQNGLSAIPSELRQLLPELILLLSFVLILVWELFGGSRKDVVIPIILIVGIISSITMLVLAWGQSAEEALFFGMIRLDFPARFVKIIVGICALVSIIFSARARHFLNGVSGMGEYYLLLTSLLIGLFAMCMASHLLFLYLSIELVSISSYLLTAYIKKDRASAEASVKYILFGAFSSGIMLYGISLLYGLSGSLDPSDSVFIQQLGAHPMEVQVMGLSLLLAGLLFKIGAVPFQFWVPDIYQGASFPIVAFFSVAPKAAAFLLLTRLLFGLESLDVSAYLQWILIIVAIASMTLGNLAALWQGDIKRLLAYSSIAHAGYMMMGVSCFSMLGRAALLYYLAIYLTINLGTFLLAGLLITPGKTAKLSELAGLGKRLPLVSVCLSICLVALVGIPPTSGFVGKWYLFLGVWEQIQHSGETIWWVLILAALINTVISLFYYLKIPVLLFFRNKMDKPAPPYNRGLTLLAGILCVPVILLGFWGFDLMMNWIQLGLWN